MAASFTRYQQTRCLRRGWLFERVGWALMAMVIAAAVIGVFGGGWLSEAEGARGEASVRYPRFARAHAPFVISINWPAQDAAVVTLDRAYLEHFSITEIRPTPSSEAVDVQSIHYSFETRDGAGRVAAEFELRAHRGGRFNGSIAIGTEPPIAVRQLIFP